MWSGKIKIISLFIIIPLSLFVLPVSAQDEDERENEGVSPVLLRTILELEEFGNTIAPYLDSIRDELKVLEHELVRTSGEIMIEEKAEAEEKGEEEATSSQEEDFWRRHTETGHDTTFLPPVTITATQRIRELEEERRELNNRKQLLFLKHGRFKEAIQLRDYIAAEMFRTDMEMLIQEINSGIESIRDEMVRTSSGLEE
jgi:hypothetical protein